MKRLMFAALAAGSMIAGSTAMSPAPAQAWATCQSTHDFYVSPGDFKAWEHPFYCDRSIRTKSQSAADSFCRTKYVGEIFSYGGGNAAGTTPYTFNQHVWAHVYDGLCVYNDSSH